MIGWALRWVLLCCFASVLLITVTHGGHWLPALDNEGPLTSLDLAAWREALRVRATSLYTTMRALYEQIGRPDSFLITAVRLGGQHGYDSEGAVAPMGGAVVGFGDLGRGAGRAAKKLAPRGSVHPDARSRLPLVGLHPSVTIRAVGDCTVRVVVSHPPVRRCTPPPDPTVSGRARHGVPAESTPG